MENIKPIDFDKFKVNDSYRIINLRNEQVFYARIDHFRKGIAIAHTSHFDCLINVKCEIVYMPSACFGFYGCEMENPRIGRNLDGTYEVWSTKDISAPGKDSDYSKQSVDDILDENLQNEKEFLYAPIYEYPMSIPYERGKIIYRDRKFIDLETLEILYEHPESETFRVESEVVDGWCDILDEKYYKCLLVEVQKGKIVDYKDVTNVKSLFMNNSLSYENKIEEANLIFLRQIVDDSITSDIRNAQLKFLKEPFSDLSEYPDFFQWLRFLKQINSSYEKKYNKRWTVKIPYSSYYDVLEYNFCNGFYIIRSAKTESSGKTFIYDEYGKRLNDEPYSRLLIVKDSKHLYGDLVLRMSRYDDRITGFLIIDSNKKLKEYPYYSLFTQATDNLDMCFTYGADSTEPIGEAEDVDIYFNHQYFDIKLRKKDVCYIDSIGVETIIEHYCYKTPTGERVFFPDDDIEQAMGSSHKDGKIVFTSKECDEVTIGKIKAEFDKGNKYVTDIHPLDNFNNYFDINSNSSFYVFEYQPYGKMNMKGEFQYDLNPEQIVL